MSVIRLFVIAALLAAWGVIHAAPPAAQVDVKSALERIMARHKFEIRGIEQTADAKGRIEGGNLLDRLHRLLENFDHIIVTAPGGRIERVIILGEKVAYVPPQLVIESDGDGDTSDSSGDIVLPTQRKGAAHIVTLTLEGPNKQRVQQSLLIDTGADQVVLPTSLIASLGLAPNTLSNQSVQTANGTVQAQVGTLAAIWLGDQRLTDIGVAFIDDQRLGGQALLGMNVLGRYQMTIDDENSRLTLSSK